MSLRLGWLFLLASVLVLVGQAARGEGVDLYGDPLPPGALARLGSARLRHGQSLDFLAFAPDNATLVSGTWRDGGLQLWDLASGKALHRVSLERSNEFVAFAAGGAALVHDHENDCLHLWDLSTGKVLRRLSTPGGLSDATWSPDGKLLALVLTDGSLLLWDVVRDRLARRLSGPNQEKVQTRYTRFAGQANLLALGEATEEATTLRFWDLTTGREQQSLKLPPARSPELSPDGRRVTVRTWAGGPTVSVLDRQTGKEVYQITGLRDPWRLRFSPDGSLLAVGDAHGVGLHDPASGRLLRRLSGLAGEDDDPAVVGMREQHLAFSPDGKTVAVCTSGNRIHLWDVASGRARRQAGHEGAVASVVWSPDGAKLASVADDQTARVWDAGSGRELSRVARTGRPSRRNPDPGPAALAFQDGGKQLAVVWPEGGLGLWDAATGKQLRQAVEVPGGPHLAVFSPDGKVLCRSGRDGSLRFFEMPSERELRRLPGPPIPEPIPPRAGPDLKSLPATAIALAHDGRTAALGRLTNGDPMPALDLWERASASQRWRVRFGGNFRDSWPTSVRYPNSSATEPICHLLFSPDDKVLAVGLYGMIHLWDLAAKRELRRQKTLDGDYTRARAGVAFSPDGKLLAIGTDGDFYLSCVATGEEVCRVRGHRGPVTALAFSPDGTALASGGADTTLLIWDVRSLTEAARRRRAEPTIAELDALWADLAGDDGEKADRAIWALAAVPQRAVPWLRERLQPVPSVDRQRITRLIAELGHDKYATRQQAAQELMRLADLAEPALRQALAEGPPLERRRRLEELLAKIDTPEGQRLRVLRAVEVLERCGGAEARRLLQELAGGVPEARLTREARAALDRLRR